MKGQLVGLTCRRALARMNAMNWLAQAWDRYRRTPKALRWVAWPVVLLLAAYVIEDWRGRKAQADFFAKWNAAGIPLSWDDVRNANPAPRSEDDFLEAPIIADYIQAPRRYPRRISEAEAGSRMTCTNRKARDVAASSTGILLAVPFDRDDPAVRSNEDQARHILTFLGPRTAVLDEVAEAVKRPERRWARPRPGRPGDYFEMEDYQVGSTLRFVAQGLHARARANFFLGHHQPAFEDILTLLRIARVQEHPVTMVVGGMTSKQVCRQTLELVWEGMHREVWDEARLAELAAALEPLHPTARFPRALQFENAIGNWLFDHSGDRQQAIVVNVFGSGDSKSRFLAGVMHTLAPEGAISQLELGWTRMITEELIAPGRVLSPELRIEHLDRYQARLAAPAASLYEYSARTHGLAVFLVGDGNGTLLTQQKLDLARIAVALERWRLREGSYPTALADLVPRYLSAIPEDRFVPGRAVVYTLISGDNYQLHACGENRVDDGGKGRSGGWDLVWRNRP